MALFWALVTFRLATHQAGVAAWRFFGTRVILTCPTCRQVLVHGTFFGTCDISTCQSSGKCWCMALILALVTFRLARLQAGVGAWRFFWHSCHFDMPNLLAGVGAWPFFWHS